MNKDVRLPVHIGIIMDGNRRWAKKRLLPSELGHKEGAENLKRITKYCDELGIKYLTVFAFSTENWKRTDEEVNYLMDLFLANAKKFNNESKGKNYRIQLCGDKTRLSPELQKEIDIIEDSTKNNTGLTINIALNYGGRPEIINATKNIVKDVLDGKLDIDSIDEDLLTSKMQLKNSPDPDIIIRTGGEMRLSGFLLWQCAYSELYFTDAFWPDFDEKELDKAIEEFSSRKRNFGK